MQREVLAIVLCTLAHAASAQCVATPVEPAALTATVVKGNVHPVAAQAQNAAARPAGGQLIKAAAAGTRDDAPPSTAPRGSVSAHGSQDEDHPHRGSTAMLLAAVALMSGIALRRSSARDK